MSRATTLLPSSKDHYHDSCTISHYHLPNLMSSSLPSMMRASPCPSLLHVDANVIHTFNTNPATLLHMWSVFARCAGTVDHGQRLENLSWRILSRQSLGMTRTQEDVTPASANLLSSMSALRPCVCGLSDDVPPLSRSVDSLVHEEVAKIAPTLPETFVRPRIARLDSDSSLQSLNSEADVSPTSLEKLVTTIVEAKAPLDAPLPDIPFPSPPVTTTTETKAETVETVQEEPTKEGAENQDKPQLSTLERSGSTTTESSSNTSGMTSTESLLQNQSPTKQPSPSTLTTTIVHGFRPSKVDYERVTREAQQRMPPQRCSPPSTIPTVSRRQPVIFTLGASSSTADSYGDSDVPLPRTTSMLPVDAIRSMSQAIMSGSAIEDGSYVDHIDESAIEDDDDSSDWEDSHEHSQVPTHERVVFQRIDSKVDLTSRPSLISLMLAHKDKAQRRGYNGLKSTGGLPTAKKSPRGPGPGASASDSDDAPLTMKSSGRAPPLRLANTSKNVPRTAPQTGTSFVQGPAAQISSSPRTTRRNMLATELPGSLRRHLLWERTQKATTVVTRSNKSAAAAVAMRRRQTSNDVINLKQYPEEPRSEKKAESTNTSSSWDHYLVWEHFTGYHAQGW